MDIEALGLEGGKAVRDGLEPFPHCVQVVETFLKSEVWEVVGAKLVAQETGKLLVLFEKSVFPVDPEK